MYVSHGSHYHTMSWVSTLLFRDKAEIHQELIVRRQGAEELLPSGVIAIKGAGKKGRHMRAPGGREAEQVELADMST